MGAAVLHLQDLLAARFASSLKPARDLGGEASPRDLLAPDIFSLAEVMPDGGLPRGVIELTAQHALGAGARIALSAIRAVQAADARAWCAWVDPEGTLYAPSVLQAGVDLRRLLVVRCTRAELARITAKVVGAGACELVVVDLDPVPGAREVAHAPRPERRAPERRTSGAQPNEIWVRKLSLSTEKHGGRVLLLSDSRARPGMPLPVAMRIELSRHGRDHITLRITKERHGRIGLAKTLPFEPLRYGCTGG